MINFYIFCILFFTICEGKIEINISTSNYLNRTMITYKGSDIKHVTDKEILLFNITKDNLSRGVKKEFGKYPDEIYLKDPTYYGDVFKKHKWPEVRRTLSVKNITIVEFIKKGVVLNRIDHINNSTDIIRSKIEFSEPVTNTITAIWNKRGLPEDDIKFEVNIDFGYAKVKHEANWRDPGVAAFDLYTRKTEAFVDIPSGQSIVAKLLTEKIILLIEVEMHAHLKGNILVNYARKYGSQYQWSPKIENIMKAAKLYNGLTTTLLIEVRYYTNGRIEVIDKNSGADIVTTEKNVQKKLKLKLL